MKLSDLVDYANDRYQIQEQHKWADFPGFSVLCHPRTGKWVALLMRQWSPETGSETELCDLKCGIESISGLAKAYLSSPLRMHGSRWVNVAFSPLTEAEVVFNLFDKAISSGDPHGCAMVLGSGFTSEEHQYKDTALPFENGGYRLARPMVLERLKAIERFRWRGADSVESRARTFFEQAMLLNDYEDDSPWIGDVSCYFPTYQSLTSQQLRGYFSWRTQVRKGNYQRIASSAAYIYLYELLNGVGVENPEDCIRKLREFEIGYLDSGIGDNRMRQNLRKWMLEYSVIKKLPVDFALEHADKEMIERDRALAALRDAEDFDDATVFSALCVFYGKKMKDSSVIVRLPERGKSFFSAVWKMAISPGAFNGDFFSQCFGKQVTRRWYPLSNAVYYERTKPSDGVYVLDECRRYQCMDGLWKITFYEKLSFNATRFQGLLHQADAMLRRYLKTGHYLKENPADGWAVPIIEAVIEADRRALIDATHPKVSIDLSNLERIRSDAADTRDNLLTEEELGDGEEQSVSVALDEHVDFPLDSVQVQALLKLLDGEDGTDVLKAHHIMPSVAADFINEALFDEIGDNVLTCESDRLFLVEDYIEDLKRLLGGRRNG